MDFAVAATVGLLVAVFGFTTLFLTAAGGGVATTRALPDVELRLFDFVFFADFFAGFLGAFFATAVFLTVFLPAFFAAFFAVFLAAFFAPRLLTFARFFTADAFAVLARADFPAVFAFCFLEVFFLGVATTNSFMLKPDC